MNPSSDDTTKLEQTSHQVSELAAIRRMLEISEGTFSLSVAVCNSPSLRDYLIKKLREEYSSIKLVEIKRNVTDIFDFVSKSATGKKSDGIFITGIEAIISSDEKEQNALQSLNATREAWKSRFLCPVVFWVAEYVAKLLSIHARDLWSWLSHSFEFVSEQATASAGIIDAFSGDILSAGRLDADEKRFRIAELEQRIADAGDPPKTRFIQHILNWLNELSYIYHAIGELDKSEQMLKKSLGIEENLGRPERMAGDYSNLGLVYLTRGELDRAEQMLKKSLEINEKLGQPMGMAIAYGNLGFVYRERGELNKAEQMYKKSLEINEKLGRLEGMSNQYGNLGVVYLNKGELDKAEQILKKSLEIDEKLDRPEGIAKCYGNLGIVYAQQGDLKKAMKFEKKARDLFKKIGMVSETKKIERFIDEIKGK